MKEILTKSPRGFHPSARYIYRKQLEEADVIVLNKMDLMEPAEREDLLQRVKDVYPETEVRCLSSKTGEGLEDWLQAMLSGEAPAGRRVVEVDYDTYAEGEAVLGWLNSAITLERRGNAPAWDPFCRLFMERLQQVFRQQDAPVGHVKLLLQGEAMNLVANLTHTEGAITLRGDSNDALDQAEMIFNARVEMPPEDLKRHVAETLNAVAGDAVTVNIRDERCLSPSRPVPTLRYDRPLTGGEAR